MRKRLGALAAVALAGSVLLAGCQKKTETTTTETEKTTDTGGTYATPATTPMAETTPSSMGGTMETTPGGAPRTTTPSP
jgi:uncharacterized lipoprotein YajG